MQELITPQLPLWVEYAKALGTPAAALIAAGTGAFITHKFGTIQASIAQRQANTAAEAARTAKSKLKLDLFDKRQRVYQAATDMYGAINTKGKHTLQEQLAYRIGVSGCQWLFDDDIRFLLETTIWTKMIELEAALAHVDGSERGTPERIAAAERASKARKALLDSQKELEEACKPFLQIEA
jgi:hypothetical protein